MKLFILRTDASGDGVASVLLHRKEVKLYRVGYASNKLDLAEAKYLIKEKGCLAVAWGIRRFKRFTLQTDHKPLKHLKDAAYQNDHGGTGILFNAEDIPSKENIGADFWSQTGYSC